MVVSQEVEAEVDGVVSVLIVDGEVAVTDPGTMTALVVTNSGTMTALVVTDSAVTVPTSAAASTAIVSAALTVSMEAGCLSGVAQGVPMTGAGGAALLIVKASAAALLVGIPTGDHFHLS